MRGDTRIPSFTSSSAAIRSSPHVRFAAAVSAMIVCNPAGTRGRLRDRDLRRRNNWNPFRCQRINVSGLTTVRTRRHSISRDSATRTIRVALSARLGRVFRSTYNASCLRGNRFSPTELARLEHRRCEPHDVAENADDRGHVEARSRLGHPRMLPRTRQSRLAPAADAFLAHRATEFRLDGLLRITR